MSLSRNRFFLFVCLVFVTLFSNVYAQQGIEGPIGLFESVAKYTFYSKDFTINTKETNIMSFEIIVTLDATESGDFYLSVDGVYCNPDKISYPSSTRYQVSFDCKGSISKTTDTHTVRFYSTTDLTNVKVDYRMLYTNRQTLRLSVHGTEYHPGDIATIFLHLTDENSQPIDNSTCFVSVWDPDKIKIIDEADMNYLDDGIYYFDMPVPWEAGVYMISVYCVIPMYIHYNYTHYTFAYDGFECGGWNCGYGWGDDWYHGGHSDVGSYNPYNGSYELRLRGANGYVERSLVNLCDTKNVTLTLHWRADSFESADEAYLNFWDGSWHTIHTWSDGDDDNTWHTLTINLSDLNLTLCTNILAIDATGLSGTGDYLYIDDIKVEGYRKEYYETNESVYQFVRGSGELHVSPRDTGCFPETAGFYYPNDLVFVQVKSDAPEVEIWVYNENKTLVAYGNATPFSSVHRIWFYNMTAPSESGLYTVYAKCTYDGYKTDGITTFYVSPTQLDNITSITTDIKDSIGSSNDNTTSTLFGYFNITYSKLQDIYDNLIELKNEYNKTLIEEIKSSVDDLKEMHNCSTFNTTICNLLDQISNGVTRIEGSIITNMEVTQLVYPGTQFKATITVVHISGAPVDADNITIKIYDPSQNLVYQGSPQHHESQGAYKFEWSVPANPALGIYTIYADITVGNVTTVEYDVFRVAQTGPFDVIVKVLKKQVTSASFVPAKITVQNKGEVGVDATVTYWIEDSLGNTISSAQETWFVPADGEVVKDVQLYVPNNAKVGTYYFKAKALYDITRPPATGYDTFYVVKQIGTQPSGVSGGTYPALQALYHNVTFNMSIPMTVQVLYKGQLIREEYVKPMESMLLKEGEYTFTFRAKGYHPVMVTVKVDRDLTITISPEKITGGVFPEIPQINVNTLMFIIILVLVTYLVTRR